MKQILATPSPPTTPVSRELTQKHTHTHTPSHAQHTMLKSTRTVTVSDVVGQGQGQASDRYVKGVPSAFTLAICNSTMQCLMDSTML